MDSRVLTEKGFAGPPRPTRAVIQEAKSFLSLSRALESTELLNEGTAIASLPALAGEVAIGQKHQIAELQRRQELLEQLKTSYSKVHERVDIFRNEINAVTRKVYLTEDQIDSKRKICQDLQSGIDSGFKEKQDLHSTLLQLKRKLDTDLIVYETYRNKILSYKQNVRSFYQNSLTTKEIERVKEDTENLKMEVQMLEDTDELKNGETRKLFEGKIEGATMEEQTIKDKNKDTLVEVRKEEDKHRQIKRDIETLQKRNNAQLTRLKRQLQEANGRIRQWGEDLMQLQRRMNELKSQLQAPIQPESRPGNMV